MLADLTLEEISAGLDAVVEEILAQCRWEKPPVDAFSIAQAMGITIALDDCQAGRARYVRLSDRSASRPKATILLRSDPRLERRQWAVAHEIGEHAAHRAFNRLGVDPCETSPRAREQIANQLAGRLLIPSHWFGEDAAALNWDLLSLKGRYRTASHELIARRMLECRPAVIITIFDQGRITFRRGNLQGRIPPPSAAEWNCWRLAHEKNRPHAENDGLNSIQGWPVHEADWKREILRYESAGFED
jgi:Zn-dependent peptidase ImmA (M78 family)